MDQTADNTHKLREYLKKMASPAILFYALPWLMILLTAGTLAQRDLGLYAAQHMYFSAWVFWLGPLPLPGTYMTLAVITLCLLAKFLLYSPWRAHQAGIILTHLGILILMIGGIITAFSQKEGFLLVGEGQSVQAVSDYHKRVITIKKNDKDFAIADFEALKTGHPLPTTLPFKVDIESLCRNCRPTPVKNSEGRHGFAQDLSLREAPPEKENEANLSGVTLKISGVGTAQDGIYVMMEEVPHKPSITWNDAVYEFSIGRAQTVLPFEIELKDFKRELHPGTDMARGFSSDIVIKDGDVEWPYLIRMNEPLRYKGYTFYQSSFSLRPDGEYSVLSVVRNQGRIFPYLASAIIFAGLLLHVFIRLRNAKGRNA